MTIHIIFIALFILLCTTTTRTDQFRLKHYSAFVHIKNNIVVLIIIMRMMLTISIFIPILLITGYYGKYDDTQYYTTLFIVGFNMIADTLLSLDSCCKDY